VPLFGKKKVRIEDREEKVEKLWLKSFSSFYALLTDYVVHFVILLTGIWVVAG